jgi:hypothetical protein
LPKGSYSIAKKTTPFSKIKYFFRFFISLGENFWVFCPVRKKFLGFLPHLGILKYHKFYTKISKSKIKNPAIPKQKNQKSKFFPQK